VFAQTDAVNDFFITPPNTKLENFSVVANDTSTGTLDVANITDTGIQTTQAR